MPTLHRFRALTLALLAACAPTAPSGAPAPEPMDEAPARHALRPVPVPAAFRAAMEKGTRSAAGVPGPRYWQQGVRYRIEAELDPATAELRGRERVVYRNHSPDTLPYIVLNLYQNVFTETARRNRVAPNTGGVTLERVAVGGAELSARPAPTAGAAASPGYTVSGTLARVHLPRPLAPGDSLTLEVAWRHRVPPAPVFRTGWDDALGGRVLAVAQWYPQVATYDDVRGWDETPYLGDGEFYLEHGDFDVFLTLPAGWLVGATGTLANPQAVLAPQVLARLRQAERGERGGNVVTEADRAAGPVTLPGANGKVTWRFTADGVRDFAFSTSDRYVWDLLPAHVPIGLPSRDGRAGFVRVNALYRPGAPGWGQAARYAQHTIDVLSRELVPYPYPQVTVAEGPIGGMEYPMLVFIGRPAQASALHSVIAHEVAHQWFPMLVGQDEAAYAWMDEGLATFLEDRARADFFPGTDPFGEAAGSYLRVAGRESEVPLARHTDLVSPYGARGVAAYTKPGTLLRSLRAVLGDSVFDGAMRTYVHHWKGKHPTPWDFFHLFEAVSGRDLDWFWHPWWYETGVLDQAVTAVQPTDGGVRVTVRDLGDNPMPVLLVVTTADGGKAEMEVPVESWLERRTRTLTVDVPASAPVTRVEIDPGMLFPDVDRRNNAWSAGSAP